MVNVDDILFCDGQDAFDKGYLKSSCPHVIGSKSSWIWQLGWDEAEWFAAHFAARVPVVTVPPR